LTDLGLAHTFIVVANGSTNRYVLEYIYRCSRYFNLSFAYINIHVYVTNTSIYIYDREKFIAKYGFFEIPCLLDPNTGVELFSAKDITKYLDTTYTV
jgi:hypothetical protein